MKTTHDFAPGTRYLYDFGPCSASNGFAQIDTGQDASYYGTWANPFKLMTVCFCEGDVTINEAETPEEFAAHIREIRDWNEQNGHRFLGIDPGCNEALRAQFVTYGLHDLLH